jgi:hypothetical protein
MPSVTHVVTNVELVIVHNTRLLNAPYEKKQSAGEGATLFDTLMTSYLAGVSQNYTMDKY